MTSARSSTKLEASSWKPRWKQIKCSSFGSPCHLGKTDCLKLKLKTGPIYGMDDIDILISRSWEPWQKRQWCMGYLSYRTMVHGKQHRGPIMQLRQWRASWRLQIVHAYLCGSIALTSNNIKRYIAIFIDDLIRKLWLYPLHEKLGALKTLKHSRTLGRRKPDK